MIRNAHGRFAQKPLRKYNFSGTPTTDDEIHLDMLAHDINDLIDHVRTLEKTVKILKGQQKILWIITGGRMEFDVSKMGHTIPGTGKERHP